MAERCVSGEFGGSAYFATKSPTTARMGISRGAIERQMRAMNPTAHAARIADRERVAAEITEARACERDVEIVFVERGGSSSAKKMLGDLTQKLEGMALSGKMIH